MFISDDIKEEIVEVDSCGSVGDSKSSALSPGFKEFKPSGSSHVRKVSATEMTSSSIKGWQQVKCEDGEGEDQLKYFKMEDDTVKVKKKNKTGPLKSTPGFLKCMRNVYLYFKEEKEKGALNIPINSFIERTAVACGVGRKTLYNYAKKGLFDEHPTILQPKQKKKRGKRKLKQVDIQLGKRGRKKATSPMHSDPGPSASPPYELKKEPPSPRSAKHAMIQTDPRPIAPTDNLVIQSCGPTGSDGFTNFIINREQKVQQVQVVQPNKVLSGSWPTETTTTTTTTTIKRDVDYFPKNNIWHAVYNLQTAEGQTCGAELNAGRMATCQQTSGVDHLTDL